MQADILAFIIFDMNFYLRWRRVFVRLHVRPYDVVGFARRNTLSKFTPLVGIQLPFGLFLVGAPAHYFKISAALAAGDDVAFIYFVFGNIEVGFTFRTQHHLVFSSFFLSKSLFIFRILCAPASRGLGALLVN